MTTGTDDMMKELGNPGKFQVFLLGVIGFSCFPILCNIIIMAVYGAKVPFHCNVDSDHLTNGSHSANSSITMETCYISSINGTTNQTEACTTGWVYDTTEISMVTEWDLVCDKEYLVALSTSIYFAGTMFGGLVVGFLSDTIGRRPVILFTAFAQLAVGVGIFFVPNYTIYAVLRFVHGFVLQGLQTACFAMVMELYRPAHRSIVGPIMELFWGISYVSLAGIWYLIQDWRYIQLAITLPSVLTISYICILPESLRWLVSKNKFEEADKVVKRFVQFNKIAYPKVTLPLKPDTVTTDAVTKTTTYTVLDLFRTPNIRKRSLILFFQWFSISFIYFGLSLGVTQLAGNKFLNFFISGAVELPVYIVNIFVLKRFGRRIPMSTYLILSGLACIGSSVADGDDPTRQTLSLALVMIGKASGGGLVSMVFMYASELYPTVIRNIGCGACALFMRAGGLSAPQILRLRTNSFKQLPFLIFGGFGLAAGGLSLLLPETLNTKLPDKIEDVDTVAPPIEQRMSNRTTNESGNDTIETSRKQ